MASQPPPTGWVNVPYTDAATVKTCAKLLRNSTPDSTKTTLTNLTTLLQATYSDASAASASQPLFYLYYCASQDLCVAFYKSINRGTTPTSAGGTASRRWWCITVGVAPTPATGWSYPYVKSICTYFYYSVLNPGINDILVTAEDFNRQMDPASYEVDACYAQLGADTSVTQQSPPNSPQPANGYPPWTVCLKPGNQIQFTQLTL